MFIRARVQGAKEKNAHQPALPDQTVQAVFGEALLSVRAPLPVPAQCGVLHAPAVGVCRQVDGLDREEPELGADRDPDEDLQVVSLTSSKRLKAFNHMFDFD